MRHHDGAADEHGGHPPDGGRGVHAAQHHQALRQGPQPRLLLQLSASLSLPLGGATRAMIAVVLALTVGRWRCALS